MKRSVKDREKEKEELLREIQQLREKVKRLEEDKFRIIQR
jgi:hypothetical protein